MKRLPLGFRTIPSKAPRRVSIWIRAEALHCRPLARVNGAPVQLAADAAGGCDAMGADVSRDGSHRLIPGQDRIQGQGLRQGLGDTRLPSFFKSRALRRPASIASMAATSRLAAVALKLWPCLTRATTFGLMLAACNIGSYVGASGDVVVGLGTARPWRIHRRRDGRLFEEHCNLPWHPSCPHRCFHYGRRILVGPRSHCCVINSAPACKALFQSAPRTDWGLRRSGAGRLACFSLGRARHAAGDCNLHRSTRQTRHG